MPHNQPTRFAIAMSALAMTLAATSLHADSFTQTNLVSDIPNFAANTDPNLKNPWGVSFSGTSPFWTSDQATGLATLYSAAGTPQSLVVTIPGGSTGPAGPTGTVFNSASASFVLSNGTPATFIFANLNGTISGWNAGAGTTALVEATTAGAVYTGLAQFTPTGSGSPLLYAANSSAGRIDVFNSSFAPTTLAGTFTDPNLPTGFVPFNIQNIGGILYVTYEQPGMGGGVVDEFDTNGIFLKRVSANAAGGVLNAPWGVVIAPSGFGSFSNDLLIGNFGNGEINAFDATTGMFLGTLDGTNGQPLMNDHLWALETRNGVNGFNPDAVYFSAGINDEADGLFAEITEVPEPATIFGTAFGLAGLALAGLRRKLQSLTV